MKQEQLPLPVAMRAGADEFTDQDFEALYKRALEMQSEQPEQPPRKIPMRTRVPVPA